MLWMRLKPLFGRLIVMQQNELKALLRQVRDKKMDIEEALSLLQGLETEDLGFALLDHQRSVRQGFPEVVFCQGKKPEQTAVIMQRLSARDKNILGTRADEATYLAVKKVLPEIEYHPEARLLISRREKTRGIGNILVLTAGTSDIPVAEEAALTAELMGAKVVRVYDAGVAGLHRLLEQKEKIKAARVIVVVAGMEGALASVVGGLVDKPVIAVPTSVGYGASFNGLAALLSMLNSCASGVSVVNIDNGFGGGFSAALINRLAEGEK